MSLETVLIGFAQIAISLAAFTTIASVVVQISASTTENLLAVRLKATLLFSMQLLVLSVLPIVFHHLDPENGAYWRYSATGSLATAAVVAYIGLFDQMPKVLRDPKNSWPQTVGVTTSGLASIATSVLTLTQNNPAFWYFATIALMLAGTLTMIIGLVLSLPVFDVHRKKTEK